MIQLRRLRLIIMAALAAILIGTVAAYWLNPPVRVALTDQIGSGEELGTLPHLKGLSYTQVEDGVKKWSLASDVATYDEKAGRVVMKTVYLRFYPAKGGEITLRSKTGEYYQKDKIVILRGDVIGQTSDGVTLKAPELRYSETTHVVVARGNVTVSGARFIVHGVGMTVNIDESKVYLHSKVDSTFVPVGSGPPPGATVEEKSKR
jgi:LPS export ABC transporter protein LptC